MAGNSLHRFIGSVAGTGFLKPAPGTWGSLVALIFFLFFHPVSVSLIWLVFAFSLILSIWSGNVISRTGTKDPSWFVLDEWAGMTLVLLLSPDLRWMWVIPAFLLFRIFDIYKPAGISRLQQLPGGWGILADDLAAGLAASGVLWIFYLILN